MTLKYIQSYPENIKFISCNISRCQVIEYFQRISNWIGDIPNSYKRYTFQYNLFWNFRDNIIMRAPQVGFPIIYPLFSAIQNSTPLRNFIILLTLQSFTFEDIKYTFSIDKLNLLIYLYLFYLFLIYLVQLNYNNELCCIF